ncbi:MAG: hypothetical protein M1814_004710 [Vezdaea aestivalis]|nr:MAG: hypothetical protein M1814_004710 [Vezdaea aestivalis]
MAASAETPGARHPRDNVASIDRRLPRTLSTPTAGGCHYQDLTLGDRALCCGCRRFHTDATLSSSKSNDNGEWCFCGHHSCYHDRVELQGTPSSQPRDRSVDQRAIGMERSASYDRIFDDDVLRTRRVQREETQDLPPLPSQLPITTIDQHHQHFSLQEKMGSHIQHSTCEHSFPSPAAASRAFGFASFDSLGRPSFLASTHTTGRKITSNEDTRNDQEPQRPVQPSFSTSIHPRDYQCSGTSKATSPCHDIKSGFRTSTKAPLVRDDGLRVDVDMEDDIDSQAATELVTPSVRTSPDVYAFAESADQSRLINQTFVEVTQALNGPRDSVNEDQGDQSCQKVAIKLLQSFRAWAKQQGPERVPLDPNLQQAYRDRLSKNLHVQIQIILGCLREYSGVRTQIRGLNHRVEALENTSFSAGSNDGIADKVEYQDSRLLEVEGSLEDLTQWKAILDQRSIGSLQAPTSSITSATGQSTSSTGPLSHLDSNVAVCVQQSQINLERLVQRVNAIESYALPSRSSPWRINVVILPWGRNLRGIWNPCKNGGSPEHSELVEHEWTQHNSLTLLPEHRAKDSLKVSHQGRDAGFIRRWASTTNDWMSAKACDSSSTVYQRLQSRGLVGPIQLCGASARDLDFAVESAFGNALDAMNGGRQAVNLLGTAVYREQPGNSGIPEGLGSRFIPLRKIRKISRLQFLGPRDLVSPTLWDAMFLQSDVLMNPHRQNKTLFLTTRDAYLQHRHTSSIDWTWDALRELSIRPNSNLKNTDIDAQISAAELTDCWNVDSRIDATQAERPHFQQTLSYRSSNNSYKDSAASSRGAQASSSDRISRVEQSSSAGRAVPISPNSEHPMPQQVKSTFVPLIGPNSRVTKRPNSLRAVSPRKNSFKRQRLSIAEPQSPFFNEVETQILEPKEADPPVRKRAGTPTAYATPFSGFLDARLGSCESSDVSDDLNEDVHCTGEESWKGMDDEEDENEEKYDDEDEIEDDLEGLKDDYEENLGFSVGNAEVD